MLNIKFPIKGVFREPLLFLECILFFSLLEIGIIFLQKYFSKSKEVRNSTEVAYGLFFFFYSINRLLRIISDFILIDQSLRESALEICYILQIFGIFFFIISIESQKTFIKPYFFTVCISVLLVLAILLYFVAGFSTVIITIIIWVFFSYFLLIYLYSINLKMKFRENMRYKIIYFYIGFNLLIFGSLLSAEWAINLFGIGIRALGALMQIISIIFIFLYINTLPPFTEFDWSEEIKSLFLVEKSGLSIFTKHFKEDLKEVNPTLVGGTLTTAHLMLETIINEKGFSVIKRPDYTLIIYSGSFITGIIFSDKDLNSLKYLLKTFIIRVEEIYGNVLKDWAGDLSVFQPVEAVCNEIFNVSAI